LTISLGCFTVPPPLSAIGTSSSTTAESGTSTSPTNDTWGDETTDDGDSTAAPATTTTADVEGTSDGAEPTSGVETTGSKGDVVVLGPLVPQENLDDGAMYPAGDGYLPHWYPSGEENAEGCQYLGQFPTSAQYYGYMRFQLPEAVPAGAVVDSVVLEIFGHDEYSWNGAYALRVWVQDTSDAAAVGGTFDYPQDGSSVVLSTESVRWPEEGGLVWQQPGPNATPDLAALLQALIDAHGGLAAGAYVQLWVGEDVLDGSGEEVGWLDSIAGDETAPRLTLQFHPP